MHQFCRLSRRFYHLCLEQSSYHSVNVPKMQRRTRAKIEPHPCSLARSRYLVSAPAHRHHHCCNSRSCSHSLWAAFRDGARRQRRRTCWRTCRSIGEGAPAKGKIAFPGKSQSIDSNFRSMTSNCRHCNLTHRVSVC